MGGWGEVCRNSSSPIFLIDTVNRVFGFASYSVFTWEFTEIEKVCPHSLHIPRPYRRVIIVSTVVFNLCLCGFASMVSSSLAHSSFFCLSPFLLSSVFFFQDNVLQHFSPQRPVSNKCSSSSPVNVFLFSPCSVSSFVDYILLDETIVPLPSGF